FHASPMAIAIQRSADGRFVDANRSFFELTGYAAEQLLHRAPGELGLWESPASANGGADEAVERIRNRPVTLRRNDGTKRDTLMWTELIALETEACRLVIVDDVTE